MVNSTRLTLPAPAKLNLLLNILDRRPDGYHNLQTVFQFIDLADELKFTLTSDSALVLETPDLSIPHTENLIYRAAKRLQEKTSTTKGAHIQLNKILPIGGGIGGGSSNAATTLVGLNRLWKTELTRQELMALGAELGADVPIFIHGEAAYATGIGEKMAPIELPEPWYVLVIPPINVATQEIFSHPQLTRNNQPITISDFLEQGGGNSCEKLVRALYPEIAQALDWLSQFGSAKMSGTGCTVFAGFTTKSEANRVISQLPAPFKGLVAKGCNKSVLFQ